jgi:hypothetical protein
VPREQDVWGGERVPFTTEEDAQLVARVRFKGRKGGRLFGELQWGCDRIKAGLKYRLFMLDDMERNVLMARLSDLFKGSVISRTWSRP